LSWSGSRDFDGIRPCAKLALGEKPITFAKYDGIPIFGLRDTYLPLEEALRGIVGKVVAALRLVRVRDNDLYRRLRTTIVSSGGYIYIERCPPSTFPAKARAIDAAGKRIAVIGLSYALASDFQSVETMASIIAHELGHLEPFIAGGEPGEERLAAELQIRFSERSGGRGPAARLGSAAEVAFRQKNQKPLNEDTDDIELITEKAARNLPGQTPWELAQALSRAASEEEKSSVPSASLHHINMPKEAMEKYEGAKACPLALSEEDAPYRKYDGITVFGLTDTSLIDPSIDLEAGLDKIVRALKTIRRHTPDLYRRLKNTLLAAEGYIYLDRCPPAKFKAKTRLISAGEKRLGFIGVSIAVSLDGYNEYNVASLLIHALAHMEPYVATGVWAGEETAANLQLAFARRVGDDRFRHSLGTRTDVEMWKRTNLPQHGTEDDVEIVTERLSPEKLADTPWMLVRSIVEKNQGARMFPISTDLARRIYFEGSSYRTREQYECEPNTYYALRSKPTVPVLVFDGIPVIGSPYLRYPDKSDQSEAFLRKIEKALQILKTQAPKLFARTKAAMTEGQSGFMIIENCMNKVGTVASASEKKIEGQHFVLITLSTDFSFDLFNEYDLADLIAHEIAHVENLSHGGGDKTELTSLETELEFADTIGDQRLLGVLAKRINIELWAKNQLTIDGRYSSSAAGGVLTLRNKAASAKAAATPEQPSHRSGKGFSKSRNRGSTGTVSAPGVRAVFFPIRLTGTREGHHTHTVSKQAIVVPTQWRGVS